MIKPIRQRWNRSGDEQAALSLKPIVKHSLLIATPRCSNLYKKRPTTIISLSHSLCPPLEVSFIVSWNGLRRGWRQPTASIRLEVPICTQTHDETEEAYILLRFMKKLRRFQTASPHPRWSLLRSHLEDLPPFHWFPRPCELHFWRRHPRPSPRRRS